MEEGAEDILADSGSALNACPSSYAPEYPTTPATKKIVATMANGAEARHFGLPHLLVAASRATSLANLSIE